MNCTALLKTSYRNYREPHGGVTTSLSRQQFEHRSRAGAKNRRECYLPPCATPTLRNMLPVCIRQCFSDLTINRAALRKLGLIVRMFRRIGANIIKSLHDDCFGLICSDFPEWSLHNHTLPSMSHSLTTVRSPRLFPGDVSEIQKRKSRFHLNQVLTSSTRRSH